MHPDHLAGTPQLHPPGLRGMESFRRPARSEPTGLGQDGHGFALSSLNPSPRVVGSHVAEALVSPSPEVPPQKMQAFTFFVSMGASYVQVARYQGRSLLRDDGRPAVKYHVPCHGDRKPVRWGE
jgi:hypothetical protein